MIEQKKRIGARKAILILGIILTSFFIGIFIVPSIYNRLFTNPYDSGVWAPYYLKGHDQLTFSVYFISDDHCIGVDMITTISSTFPYLEENVFDRVLAIENMGYRIENELSFGLFSSMMVYHDPNHINVFVSDLPSNVLIDKLEYGHDLAGLGGRDFIFLEVIGGVSFMKAVFIHELGHVLGMGRFIFYPTGHIDDYFNVMNSVFDVYNPPPPEYPLEVLEGFDTIKNNIMFTFIF